MDTALIIIADVTVAHGQVLSQKLKHRVQVRRRDMVHRPIEGFYPTDPARSCSITLQIDRFMSSFTLRIFNQHTWRSLSDVKGKLGALLGCQPPACELGTEIWIYSCHKCSIILGLKERKSFKSNSKGVPFDFVTAYNFIWTDVIGESNWNNL